MPLVIFMNSIPSLKILVVDDHEAVLGGTLNTLQSAYPEAEIQTATTVLNMLSLLSEPLPDVVVMDLALPKEPGGESKTEVGIDLLRTILNTYPHMNIVVQSAFSRALIRLRPMIDIHMGGFTVADKSLPGREMLARIDLALGEYFCTPLDMRQGMEVRPEWLEVLQLAFQEGLQDKAIAERMNVSERTVRNYWNKVQDILNVYPEAGKNIRIQTEIRAREEGWID